MHYYFFKNPIFICVFFILMYLAGNLQAQNQFFVRTGVVMPVSGFGSTNTSDIDAGGAGYGLDLGFKYCSLYNDNGLGISLSCDAIWNPLSKTTKQNIRTHYGSSSSSKGIMFPNYINLPLIGSLLYMHKADETLSVFANAGIGMDMLFVTKFSVSGGGSSLSKTYTNSLKPAYKFAAGIQIENRVHIEINYLFLGKHSINQNPASLASGSGITGVNLKMSALTATVGYNLAH